MEKLGLAEQVDGIFYSARLGAKKPDMEFFAKVQAAVGLCGEEMMLIDDSRENITAALQAGWQALHWTKHSSPGIALKLWLIGTKRVVAVNNHVDSMPSEVRKYLSLTSEDHSYIFGDFLVCPLEPDTPGQMRRVW